MIGDAAVVDGAQRPAQRERSLGGEDPRVTDILASSGAPWR